MEVPCWLGFGDSERPYVPVRGLTRVLRRTPLSDIVSPETHCPVNALPTALIEPQPGPTLTKALVRAADLLGVNQAALADLLGMSRATASRLVRGAYVLDPARKKEWELALLFVRAFRSLDAVAGHGEQARAWMTGPNISLGGRPVDLIRSAEGLVRTVQYLDAARGRI